MGNYYSPGVYSKENDLSEIVPNFSTSTGAVVGYSVRGPVGERTLITNTKQFIDTYGIPTPGNFFHYSALAFLENGNKLYCTRVVNGALFGGMKVIQAGGVGTSGALTTGVVENDFATVEGEDILFYIFGKNPGTWNNGTSIKISNIDNTAKTFSIEVYTKDADGNQQLAETVWNVSRQYQVDGNGKQLYIEDVINTQSAYITVANSSLADSLMPAAISTAITLGGGSNGAAITDANIMTAWDIYANPEEVNVAILINAGYSTVAVQNKMKTICETRKDCVAINDFPYSEIGSVTSMITWRNSTQNLSSSYIGLYGPWVKIYDQYNAKNIEVPPSGYVASMFAFNDYAGEAWTAPAGFNRGRLNVRGLTKVFTQGERDELYAAGINPLQTFSGDGSVIYGQKTQQKKASALDRMNVRRLLIVIEKSVSAALRYFLFESNSEITRFRVTATTEEFMNILAARGAFQTEGGDKGFRVVCDTTNNTPATIDRNELHCTIYVKPIRAAEFIELQVTITKTGVTFNELIARGA